MPTRIVLIRGSGNNQTVISKKYSAFGLNEVSEIDPSKIGQGQSEKERTNWGEAEQFGGKLASSVKMAANITVKAFYN